MILATSIFKGVNTLILSSSRVLYTCYQGGLPLVYSPNPKIELCVGMVGQTNPTLPDVIQI